MLLNFKAFELVLKIAKKGKTHTIAEELILPFKIDMVSNTFSPQDSEIFTLSRRISDMVQDGQNQLKKQIKVTSFFFLIQMDD